MGVPVNEKISEAVAIMATAVPVSVASAGTMTIGPVNVAQLEKVLFLLEIGAIAGGATVDAVLKSSATSGGSYANIPNTAITQVTATPTQPVGIEIEASTLAGLGVGPFVKLVATVGTAAVVLAGQALSGPSCYSPASDLGVTYQQLVLA